MPTSRISRLLRNMEKAGWRTLEGSELQQVTDLAASPIGDIVDEFAERILTAKTHGNSKWLGEFWQLCFGTHLVRLGVANRCKREVNLGGRPSSVDFQLDESLAIELTTVELPSNLPSQNDVFNWFDISFAEEKPALDLSLSFTKELDIVKDKNALEEQLRLLALQDSNAHHEVKIGERKVATVTFRHSTFRDKGWFPAGRSLQAEMTRGDHGTLRKDQRSLETAIFHGIRKLPTEYEGELLIALGLAPEYRAMRYDDWMGHMLFTGFDETDRNTGRLVNRMPGIFQSERPTQKVFLGIYEHYHMQIGSFDGLRIIPIADSEPTHLLRSLAESS